MKKIFLLVLAILFSLSTVACSESDSGASSNKNHQHQFTQTIIQPTCTQKGYTLEKCSCGEERKSNYVDKVEHSYVESEVEATCKEKGYTLNKCKNCSNQVKSNYTEGTANHSGVKTCEVCKADLFSLFVDKIKEAGTFSETSYTITMTIDNNTCSWLYNVEENTISIILSNSTQSNSWFGMLLDADLSGSYTYIMQYSSYNMMGQILASLIDTDTTSIFFTSSSFPSSLTTSAKKLGASSCKLALAMTNLLLLTIDMSVENLGFINYN